MESGSSIGERSVGSSPELQPFSYALVITASALETPSLNTALKSFVDAATYTCSTAAAVTAFEEQLYDLIVCDLSVSGAREFLLEVSRLRASVPIVTLVDAASLTEAIQLITSIGAAYAMKDQSHMKTHLAAALCSAVRTQERTFREVQVEAERNAFWAATNNAAEGIAVLTEDGTVIFANRLFAQFLTELGANAARPNIVELLKPANEGTASTLNEQLSSSAAESAWHSEIEIASSAEGNAGRKTYELTLILSEIAAKGGILQSFLAGTNMKWRVLWARDVTIQKHSERFLAHLISSTSHDLQGPLGAILNAVEIISNTSPSDPATTERLINSISSCARKSLNVIQQILSARTIEDGALKLEMQECSVQELVAEVAADFAPVANSKGISITQELVKQDQTVFGDSLALYRVLSNLMSNALKFSVPGGTVRISAKLNSDGMVGITVQDSGPGIPAGEVGTLFRRYGRLGSHGKVDGTGMGLFVVKNIVEAHGGRVEVESGKGIGAKFTVLLATKASSEARSMSPEDTLRFVRFAA